MIKQPYYMIEFSASSCLFEIRVNDIPVVSLNILGQAATRIPINYAISESGKQEITVRVLPVLGQTSLSTVSELNYNIELYDVSNSFDFKQQIQGYKSPKIEDMKIVPVFTNTIFFEATIPYQLKDYWIEGEDLNDVDDLTQKLRKSYHSLGEIINEKNYNSFKDKMINREANMASSMYLSPSESMNRINSLIYDFENGFNSVSLAENAVAVLSAYGKKAALKKPNGEFALSFINKESKEELMLDIEFYLPKSSNNFEII